MYKSFRRASSLKFHSNLLYNNFENGVFGSQLLWEGAGG